MAFDEEGQGNVLERRLAICTRAYKMLTDEGRVQPPRYYFRSKRVGHRYRMEEHRHFAVDFWNGQLPKEEPEKRTGNSRRQQSFVFVPGNNTVREAMHSVFLYHAIAAGLDMAIVKPGTTSIYRYPGNIT